MQGASPLIVTLSNGDDNSVQFLQLADCQQRCCLLAWWESVHRSARADFVAVNVNEKYRVLMINTITIITIMIVIITADSMPVL
jgi:hypothetical protein